MRRFLAWQRDRDFLKELQLLVIIVLAFLAIGNAIDLVDLATDGPVRAQLFIDTEGQPPLTTLPEGVKANPVSEVSVEIANPTDQQRLLYGLTTAPTTLILLIFFVLLATTLHRARKSDPFTRQTVTRLRWIGLTLIAGLTAVAIEGWARFMLSETITPDHWAAVMDMPLAWLFGGFLCFAVAEIVKRGCDMRDELEAVI